MILQPGGGKPEQKRFQVLNSMSTPPLSRQWIHAPTLRLVALPFAALLAINAAAAWQIFSSRRSARDLTFRDLTLQTQADARTLEAVLASRRADLIFLSQSAPLSDALAVLADRNPTVSRWRRLDIQGALLLFLAAHPEVATIRLSDERSEPVLAVGRRQGAPIVLSPASAGQAPDPGRFFVGIWPLGPTAEQGGTIEAALDSTQLLATVAPGMAASYQLVNVLQPHPETGDTSVVSLPLDNSGWTSSQKWNLVRREGASATMESVAILAGRYRTTVVLNFAVMTLALVLGATAVGQMRRRLALEGDNQRQILARELEKRLAESERLASVGRLAAGIAHEINNPLEGMSNYMTLLADDIRRGNSGEAERTLGKVREGLDRTARIVRQVLSYSDRGNAQHAPLDVHEVLEETVSFIRSNQKFWHLNITLQLARRPLRVLGNRVTLGQLFLNLFINASQMQPTRGEISVRSRTRGKFGEIEVADRGPGLAADVLPHIFEPFYSARGSTGLGLSVCHGIVKQHGGTIQAENRPDGGALFRVSLPLTLAWVVYEDLAFLAEHTDEQAEKDEAGA